MARNYESTVHLVLRNCAQSNLLPDLIGTELSSEVKSFSQPKSPCVNGTDHCAKCVDGVKVCNCIVMMKMNPKTNAILVPVPGEGGIGLLPGLVQVPQGPTQLPFPLFHLKACNGNS